MGIRLKFNLIFFIIFSLGFCMVGIVADRYLTRAALADAERAALITLDTAVLGNLDTRTAAALGSRLVDMRVKEFPTHEVQTGLEGQIQSRLLDQPSTQFIDTLTSSTGTKHLMVARKIFGANGQTTLRTADVNLAPVLLQARTALIALMSSVGLVFFGIFFALNIMLDRVIVRPVSEMARAAEAVSIGNFSIPEFVPQSNDEIGVLGVAFNRLRRSTEEAIKILKG